MDVSERNTIEKIQMSTNQQYEGSIVCHEYRKIAIQKWKSKKRRQLLRLHQGCETGIANTGQIRAAHTAVHQRKHQPRKQKNDGREFLSLIETTADILPKHPSCKHCGAKKFHHESANFCCGDGDISLANNTIPEILKDLVSSDSEESKHFRTYIRTYNNMFAFTSLGVKSDQELTRMKRGIYTFRIQGQMYHFINDLMPVDKVNNNLQLYFYDTEHEVGNRLASCPRLIESVITKLIEVLKDNPYAKFFRSLSEIPNLEDYEIILKSNPQVDQRIFNKPSVSQVAALLVEETNDANRCHRDIRVLTHGGQSQLIKYYYGCYDPLQYPLMFPYGDLGWHEGIRKTNWKMNDKKRKRNINPENIIIVPSAETFEQLVQMEDNFAGSVADDSNNISLREYYAYKLQIREDDNSLLLLFGRVLQQYVVDMYSKIETQRLDFYKTQQVEIRQEFLQGIVDAVAGGESEASNIGQRIILPTSFIGGPRYMRRKYIDAMTLVAKYGKPDIFLTMTCNPNWVEIKEHLLKGEQAHNRPDLAVRIFHAKLEELRNEILKKNIFGDVAAYSYVIEFQKRGLPHVHMLLILRSQYKLYTPDEYDKIVCAEIPDKIKYPHLFNMVVRHMMHGPCGSLNPDNVCMNKKGKCKNSYPKNYSEETTQSEDAYPIYRRRDNGVKVKVHGTWLDNRWVVPYNPYLLGKFDCHMNVEICSTVKSVKYIYKYLCKGTDQILFHMNSGQPNTQIDEISSYVSARWISPPEGMWRIYRFPLNDLKPAVIHLQLHLENYQPVKFKKTERLHNVLENSGHRRTMLTEFFAMNKAHEAAKKLNCTYNEFPQHFVWKENKKMWEVRKQGDSVGRINAAHPSEGEHYFLRLLLAKVKAPTSFNDLKTFNSVEYVSFREAALARGFLKDDFSQEHCLEEASIFGMPYELRRLFATLLVYSCPINPTHLWERFQRVLSEDFAKDISLSPEEVVNKTLGGVNAFLQSMGKNLSDYNLGQIYYHPTDNDHEKREVEAEKNIVVTENDLNSISLLNEKQRAAFDAICHSIYVGKSDSYFIDGPGGTGKTFLYRALLAYVRSKGHIALATATSGIAASILPGGRTAHSRFKIPIDLSDGTSCKVSKQSSIAALIKDAKLIIWDEASMAKRTSVESLNDLLQDIMNSQQIFGGKVIVLGGDFRQTLPVVRKGNKNETLNATLINSPLWPNFQKFYLTENVRAKLDPAYTDYLMRIGNGTEPTDRENSVTIPPTILLRHENNSQSLSKLIHSVYPDLENTPNNYSFLLNRAILTTKNSFVDEINDILIHKYPGKATEYLSFDETTNPNDQTQYEDFLNSITPNGLPPHKLILKPNAPVILLRNLDPTEGLCNGTRLICKACRRNVIQAEIAIGDFIGKPVFLHRIPLQPPSDERYPVPFKRTQFPIRLSFAMTINKAQGQTLEHVGIYLKEPVFSHGQLYVALSRAKKASSVSVLIKAPFFDANNITHTKNIVYKEVLQSPAIQ